MSSLATPGLDAVLVSSSAALVVDLDGTLVRGDLLHEALAHLGLRRPGALAGALLRSGGSLPKFKAEVAGRVAISAAHLPYHPVLLDWLRREKALGRRIVLATASPHAWAAAVAAHLGLFDDVIASDALRNTKGATKLAALRALLGESPFVYVGDSEADLPLFHAAAGRVLVSDSPTLAREIGQGPAPLAQLPAVSPAQRLRALMRGCRPHHWVKNLLIGLPAVTSWGQYDPGRLPFLGLVFAAMCALCSGVYLINDLADIASDRVDPQKRRRPAASGLLSIPVALGVGIALIAAGLGLGAAAGGSTLVYLAVYLAANIAYTMWIKELELVDVFMLSGFYLFRVLLGAQLLGPKSTFWFVSFLFCLFAELALLKKFTAARRVETDAHTRHAYQRDDQLMLLVFGVGFSFSAALILVLYTRSNEISALYSNAAYLALAAPVMLYHNLRLWLAASRDEVEADPVAHVMRSGATWGSLLLIALFVVLARTLP